MILDEQVISLELAKKLKELGVKQESLFSWMPNGTEGWEIRDTRYVSKSPARSSAFTVAELGEIMPWKPIKIKIGVYILDLSEKLGKKEWWSMLHAISSSKSNLYNHKEKADTEANSRAKMLIYMLENKIVKL
jgi:hypothetical protein